MTPVERMYAYIDASGDCWEWTGLRDPAGYGRHWDGERLVSAHRAVWEELVGEIPDDLTLDHLCRNRACVNPDHQEPVTLGINVLRGYSPPSQNARKRTCKNGHRFDKTNTYYEGSWRRCRACRRKAVQRHYAKQGRKAS